MHRVPCAAWHAVLIVTLPAINAATMWIMHEARLPTLSHTCICDLLTVLSAVTDIREYSGYSACFNCPLLIMLIELST